MSSSLCILHLLFRYSYVLAVGNSNSTLHHKKVHFQIHRIQPNHLMCNLQDIQYFHQITSVTLLNIVLVVFQCESHQNTSQAYEDFCHPLSQL